MCCAARSNWQRRSKVEAHQGRTGTPGKHGYFSKSSNGGADAGGWLAGFSFGPGLRSMGRRARGRYAAPFDATFIVSLSNDGVL